MVRWPAGDKVTEAKITYFDNPGSENTEAVLNIAKQRADELGIKTIVVASTGGDTAARAVDVFPRMKIVVVTHVTGMRTPNVQEFTEENRKKVESQGGIIVTAAHAFSGLNRAVQNKYSAASVGAMIADTLRTMGQGMKVVYEIAVMAADSGLVSTEEDIIAIAGTGQGADTAAVLRPANSHTFFDLKIKEVLCKPRL